MSRKKKKKSFVVMIKVAFHSALKKNSGDYMLCGPSKIDYARAELFCISMSFLCAVYLIHHNTTYDLSQVATRYFMNIYQSRLPSTKVPRKAAKSYKNTA